jgi:cell wall-associated NlpC family hydrolase
MSPRLVRNAAAGAALAGVAIAATPLVAHASPSPRAPHAPVKTGAKTVAKTSAKTVAKTVAKTKVSKKQHASEPKPLTEKERDLIERARAAFDASNTTVMFHNRLVSKAAVARRAYLYRVHQHRVYTAIHFAYRQLGKPYVFNANGPNAWDCSGLTAAAYKTAGIWMDDYSGSQWNAFPHVPLSQLQPGDLVFLGPGGTQHVAMYLGYGLQIAAPHHGTVVQIQHLMPNITGAVRPAGLQ